MNLVIAPTGPEYVEGFHRALDIVARERKFVALVEAPPLPTLREFVASLVEKGDVQRLALVDGEVIGWCDIRRRALVAYAHRGGLGMGIVPEYRGRGVGRRLIEATLAAAWGMGFTRVELDVYADNARAIALYQKAGFVREGVTRDAARVDGVYRDAVDMAIIRRAAPEISA